MDFSQSVSLSDEEESDSSERTKKHVIPAIIAFKIKTMLLG